MNNHKKTALSAISAVSLLAAGAAPAIAAEPVDYDAAAIESTASEAQASGLVEADAAEGSFAYDQTTITPNAVIKATFAKAAAALCGATSDFAVDNPLEWKLSVTGDVKNAFVATVDELAADSAVEQVMTCTCGGNPSDGSAIITAEVKGIPVAYLLDKAEAFVGANTVTFVSSDGTEVAIPVAYLVGRHAVISYEINDEDLSASVGGNNQLWMTRTPANYFVRDIVEVCITEEEVVPSDPGEDATYPNSPNAGILSASIR